jgi:HAD superfamily phosphoserine phosphatase-like hydrolase
MNVYDFDKTIYDGDSTIDFYLFCLKKYPKIILLLPIQFWGMLMYKLKIKEKEYYKEKFFIFLKHIKNVDKEVKEFWKKNSKKIRNWYLEQKNENDLIISASPRFLLKEICNKLNIRNLISSEVDKSNGKFLSKNCYGEEKVRRFKEVFESKKINNFYSDSYSDMPMMKLSKKSYIVDGEKITEITK